MAQRRSAACSASVYFGPVVTGAGDVAADLRVHRRRHRRHGLADGHRGRVRRGRARAAVRRTTTAPRAWATSAVVLLLALVLLVRPGGLAGRDRACLRPPRPRHRSRSRRPPRPSVPGGRRPLRRLVGAVVPLVLLAVLAYLPYVPVTVPGLLDGPRQRPGRRCSCWRSAWSSAASRRLRPALRPHRSALVRARAVRRRRRLRGGHRHDPRSVCRSAAGAAAGPRPGGVVLALVVGSVVAAGRRHRVRDGHARVRPGRPRSLVQRNPGGLDRWRGGPRRSAERWCPTCCSACSTPPYLYWLALAYLAVCWAVVRLAGADPRPVTRGLRLRENERPRRGARVSTVPGFKLGAFVVGGARSAPLGGVVHLAGHRRRQPAHRVVRAHPVAAGDGRARRRRAPGGAPSSAACSTPTSTTGWSSWRPLRPCRTSRRSCGFRCPSRCSSSAPCSSVVVYFAPGGLAGLVRGRGRRAPEVAGETG